MTCLDWSEHKTDAFSKIPSPTSWNSQTADQKGKPISFPDDGLEVITFIFLFHSLVPRDFPDSGKKIPTRITRIVQFILGCLYFSIC